MPEVKGAVPAPDVGPGARRPPQACWRHRADAQRPSEARRRRRAGAGLPPSEACGQTGHTDAVWRARTDARRSSKTRGRHSRTAKACCSSEAGGGGRADARPSGKTRGRRSHTSEACCSGEAGRRSRADARRPGEAGRRSRTNARCSGEAGRGSRADAGPCRGEADCSAHRRRCRQAGADAGRHYQTARQDCAPHSRARAPGLSRRARDRRAHRAAGAGR